MMFLFCLVVGVLLAGTYIIIYSVFVRAVGDQLDRRLLDTAHPIVADLISNPSEQDVFQLDVPNQYFELLDANGSALQSSKNLVGWHLHSGPTGLNPSKIVFETIPSRYGPLRLALLPFQLGSTDMYLAIAVSSSDADQAMASFRRTLLLLWPISLLVTGMVASWYVGRSLRPIVDLTHNAAQLTAELTHQEYSATETPLSVANPQDELGRLSLTFNILFDTVQSALSQLRQFVSDASHELRTPLAVLRGETELVLSEDRTPQQYQAALRVIESELKLLERIVEGLFTLSMADAGQLWLNKEELYLDEVLDEACEIAVPLAKAKAIAIHRDLERDLVYVGDEAFLRQLFLIFLDNAVKYSSPGTNVFVKLRRNSHSLNAEFRDEGFGIAPEHLPHIFERFYRAAGTNTSETRSGGLGLAIAQAIAQALGGTVSCKTTLGVGSIFSVVLPCQSTLQPDRAVVRLNSN